MLWLNPLLLAGLAVLVAPILIHLLMKIQGRRIPFSSLRFFPKTQGSRDRKKIRHWLLLLLRLLLLALLVIAFARPFWPADQAGAEPPKARSVLILLDCSASMQAHISGSSTDTRWTVAVAAARKALENLSGKDQAALITDADQAEIAVPWGPPSGVLSALAKLEPTSEAGQMSEGLRLAGTLLDQAPADTQRDLVLIGDLQKSSYRDFNLSPLPDGTHCDVHSVAEPGMTNVAVTGVTRQSASSHGLKITLRNFSTEKQPGLFLSCSLDQTPFFEQAVDLDPGQEKEIALPAAPLKPGWNQLAVELKSNDQIEGDNRFFSAINLPPSVAVLVAEPAMNEKIYRRTSYFVTSALDPDAPLGTPAQATIPADSSGPFHITVVDAAQLLDSIAALQNSAAANTAREVVVLPALPDVPTGLGTALKNFVADGGSVLGWVGPRMDTVGYNTELDDLWPAHFIGTENAPGSGPDNAWRLGWWKNESPLFAVFRPAGHGDLTLPEFHQRMRLAVSPNAEVLATFEDQAPFLLSRPLGHGRVLLVNTSPDTSWTDWPRHQTFLPLVQSMASYLAQSDATSGFSLAASLSPTRHGQLDLGSAQANRQVQLIPPSGNAVALQTDNTGVLRNLDLEQPGPYQIRDTSGAALQCFAVNFPATESDPDTYSPDEITGQLQFRAPASAGNPSALADVSLSARHEVWPWLLGLLLPLLLLELVLANRSRT